MADSNPSRQQMSREERSRIIREMAQNLNKTTTSVASSTGSKHGTVSSDSTQSGFNPEKDEAIMSTYQLNNDYSQKLPQLRDTAKKYGRWAPRPQQDFVINTSAIGRAFPDFSQGSSSNSSISIEAPRGNNSQPLKHNNNSNTGYSGDLNSPVITLDNNHHLNHTPQLGAKVSKSILQDALHNYRSRKASTSANIAQKENIPPTHGQRRTLVDFHARVADESDTSFNVQARPVTIATQRKASRFTTVQQSTSQSSKKEQALKSPPKHGNATQSSFLIPTSATSEPATTVVNGVQIASRGGRVLSGTASGRFLRVGEHGPVDGVELPVDEDNIYAMVDVLKARVSELEKVAVERETEIQDRDHEIHRLRERRADSALGDSRSGSDNENIDHHPHVVALQKRLDLTERRISSMELKIKVAAAERDDANSKLSKALFKLEQVEAENVSLRQENTSLRQETEQLRIQLSQLQNDNVALRHAYQTVLDVSGEIYDKSREVQDHTEELNFARASKTNRTQNNVPELLAQSPMRHINSHLSELQKRLEEVRALHRDVQAEWADAQAAKAHNDTLQSVKSGRSSRAPQQDSIIDDTMQTVQSGRSARSNSAKERTKSSVRIEDHTIRSNASHRRHHSETEDHTARSNVSHRRHHSETEVYSSRRRQVDAEEMTSAFIIPDIVSSSQKTGKERPVLSPDARRVLDGLCKHNSNNCTLCTRVASFDTKDGAKKASEQSIRIDKPIPVSKRMPSPGPYEDEPTVRPSVAPERALATVIKGVKDELAHLKMKQAEIQSAYNGHDASLGMRRRKTMEKKLGELATLISLKSDQLYGLYDVLEGQDKSVEDLTEDLPWEGIESTH